VEASVSAPLAAGSISLRLYAQQLAGPDLLEDLRAQARLAMDAGYDGVMIAEHHGGVSGYLPNPYQIVGFLLPAMPSGWAVAAPILVPLAPATLLIEHLAWLASAYPGRVGAGFGAGALPADFDVVGVPFDEANERFKGALPWIVNALRGEVDGPLAADLAIAALTRQPLPMCVAVHSPAAARRAAALDLAILLSSVQDAATSRRLCETYREAGGSRARILIRQVWVGSPPEEIYHAQLDRYRSYAREAEVRQWPKGGSIVHGQCGDEVASALESVLEESGCDTVNIRIHLMDLPQHTVRDQLERHAIELIPTLRAMRSSTSAKPSS
jgi:alkanesulfonate monooxygenase SsuD/methylene tetrahydromethanopterin reductase-like flavin-dependent oxidoreductase (luciferase family)